MAAKRELLTRRGTSRYIHRDEKGRFTADRNETGALQQAGRRQGTAAKGTKSQQGKKRS